MRLEFQRMSILTSILMSIIGFIVAYSCYGWGIYRVWSGVISYGTMTMFFIIIRYIDKFSKFAPRAILSVSLTISAGRLMDIAEMPQEDYSHDKEVEVFEKKYRMGGMGLVVEDRGYTYHTGTEVFKHASMQAFPHEVVALVGPSGEGKTTMLRLILALLCPKEGRMWVCAEKTEKKNFT